MVYETLGDRITDIRHLRLLKKNVLKECSSPEQVKYILANIKAELLGSNAPLSMLLPLDDTSKSETIRDLGDLLSRWTVSFLDGNRWEEVCKTFFHYSLHMLCCGELDSSIDDLLRLANCYASDPVVFSIVGEEYLDDEMLQSLKNWVNESFLLDIVPDNFSTAVLGAVSILTGILPDPFAPEMPSTPITEIPACSFTHDFDSALRFKAELKDKIPGLSEKLSVVEMDMFIDFIEEKIRKEIECRILNT